MNAARPGFSPNRIRTRQLQLVTQVLQDGSVLRAAEALGMSQSAASRLLAELERQVGVTLFERHARGMVPTPAGAVVARHAQAVMATFSRAQGDLMRLGHADRVHVDIGSLLSPCSDYLPAALLRLAAEEPSLVVSVHMDTSRALVRALLESRHDLVIARVGDASLVPELRFEPLVPEEFCVVARPRHPLAGRRRLSLADIAAQPWVLPPAGADLRQRLDALWLQNGLPPPTSAFETVAAPLILALLRMSDAVAALPREFVVPYVRAKSLALLDVELGARSDRFGLVTRRHQRPAPELLRVLHVLREQAAVTYRLASLTHSLA